MFWGSSEWVKKTISCELTELSWVVCWCESPENFTSVSRDWVPGLYTGRRLLEKHVSEASWSSSVWGQLELLCPVVYWLMCACWVASSGQKECLAHTRGLLIEAEVEKLLSVHTVLVGSEDCSSKAKGSSTCMNTPSWLFSVLWHTKADICIEPDEGEDGKQPSQGCLSCMLEALRLVKHMPLCTRSAFWGEAHVESVHVESRGEVSLEW